MVSLLSFALELHCILSIKVGHRPAQMQVAGEIASSSSWAISNTTQQRDVHTGIGGNYSHILQPILQAARVMFSK